MQKCSCPAGPFASCGHMFVDSGRHELLSRNARFGNPCIACLRCMRTPGWVRGTLLFNGRQDCICDILHTALALLIRLNIHEATFSCLRDRAFQSVHSELLTNLVLSIWNSIFEANFFQTIPWSAALPCGPYIVKSHDSKDAYHTCLQSIRFLNIRTLIISE